MKSNKHIVTGGKPVLPEILFPELIVFFYKFQRLAIEYSLHLFDIPRPTVNFVGIIEFGYFLVVHFL
jgi:hypothetical protein